MATQLCMPMSVSKPKYLETRKPKSAGHSQTRLCIRFILFRDVGYGSGAAWLVIPKDHEELC